MISDFPLTKFGLSLQQTEQKLSIPALTTTATVQHLVGILLPSPQRSC